MDVVFIFLAPQFKRIREDTVLNTVFVLLGQSESALFHTARGAVFDQNDHMVAVCFAQCVDGRRTILSCDDEIAIVAAIIDHFLMLGNQFVIGTVSTVETHKINVAIVGFRGGGNVDRYFGTFCEGNRLVGVFANQKGIAGTVLLIVVFGKFELVRITVNGHFIHRQIATVRRSPL